MHTELPKGGGICFVCNEPCLPLHYTHPQCRIDLQKIAKKE